MAEEKTRTIRETNALIRALVEQETLGYPFWVGGIVTRLHLSDYGHVYFDLTDEDRTMSCMIRETVRGTLGFTISNGMDMEVFGAIRVYEKSARVQIEVEKVRLIHSPTPVFDANLLKELEKKGLWPRDKRAMPSVIRHIGVVTSKQSDALPDFEDTYKKEGGTGAVKVGDVRLQGEQAPGDIVEAIRRFNRDRNVDVIALIRGGGRAAELAVFDDLQIAEAICQSTIPVVTGIGHQRDSTLADQVADHSEITPTRAALFLARATSDSRMVADSSSSKGANDAPGEKRSSYFNWLILLTVVVAVLAVIVVVLIVRQTG